MRKFYDAIGGIKFLLILIAMVLMVFRDFLGIDQETIDNVLKAAVGGTFAIAGVDIAEVLKGAKATKKKK